MFNFCTNCPRRETVKENKCSRCDKTLQVEVDFPRILHAFIWSSLLYELKLLKKNGRMEVMLSWLPSIRPYKTLESIGKNYFIHQVYFVTHLLFIASSNNICWGRMFIDPKYFVEEFMFLFYAVEVALEMKHTEMVGEILHCLRLFGVNEKHVVFKRGTEFLFDSEHKNKNGNFITKSKTTFYERYHTAYCALIGLATTEVLNITIQSQYTKYNKSNIWKRCEDYLVKCQVHTVR